MPRYVPPVETNSPEKPRKANWPTSAHVSARNWSKPRRNRSTVRNDRRQHRSHRDEHERRDVDEGDLGEGRIGAPQRDDQRERDDTRAFDPRRAPAYDTPTMADHVLERRLWLPHPRERVFDFFADPANIALVNPPSARLRLARAAAARACRRAPASTSRCGRSARARAGASSCASSTRRTASSTSSSGDRSPAGSTATASSRSGSRRAGPLGTLVEDRDHLSVCRSPRSAASRISLGVGPPDHQPLQLPRAPPPGDLRRHCSST